MSSLTKTCAKCKETKPYTEFYKCPKGRYKDGHHSYCKICIRKCSDKWREDNPEREFLRHQKRSYGLYPEDYKRMLSRQNDGCWICGLKDSYEGGKRLHTDHDHSTGNVRGILCRACNHGIGNFNNSILLMEKAIEYLKMKD